MQISFTIHYRTEARLVWQGTIGDTPMATHEMRMEDDDLWSVTLSCDAPTTLQYNYLVMEGDLLARTEAPLPHLLTVEARQSHLYVHDRWLDAAPEHLYHRPPLASLLGVQTLSTEPLPAPNLDALIACHLPKCDSGAQLLLVGSSDAYGAWQPEHGVRMYRSGHNHYALLPPSVECDYKFVLQTSDGCYHWEEGNNRTLKAAPSTITWVEAPYFAIDGAGVRPSLLGTVLPIWAMRTEKSMGVGDLTDAQMMLDWLHETGQSVLQLLPIHDTTFTFTERDSYPYNAITTVAIHPLYLDVQALPYFDSAPQRIAWQQEGRRLNALPHLDYVSALQLKWQVIRYSFDQWYLTRRFDDDDFRNFCCGEADTLLPYALFCALRDRYKGREVARYPRFDEVMQEWQASQTIEGKEAHREVYLHLFVQYHLYRQADDLRRKADRLGILLKGDLPIGMGLNSVDTWQYPHLFHLDCIAGAPPDAFAAEGQAWGFPTYDWEAMACERYRWWRHRFGTMQRLFHALRIDHILGFFRIWSVPRKTGVVPTQGYFVPALGYREDEIGELPQSLFVHDEKGEHHPHILLDTLPDFGTLTPPEQESIMQLHHDYYYHRNEALWRSTALTRLRALIAATPKMLLCAEDLGMLPSSVGAVLHDLEILSLEIVRMPKRLGSSFVVPNEIPHLSVVSSSTHDMPTLRGWWQVLSLNEKQQLADLYQMRSVEAAELVHRLTNTAALMKILPLQDWCVISGFGSEVAPNEEQINHPEDPHHVWCYRMPHTIEALRSQVLSLSTPSRD